MATQPAPTAQPTTWQMSPPPEGAVATGPNTMTTHVKVVAGLEIAWGILAAIAALVLLTVFGAAGAATRYGGAPGFVSGIIASFGIVLVIIVAGLSALALTGGIKLLHLKRSGKTITFVVAILSLFSIPFGTAYGIYALIILTRPDTDRLLVD